MDEYDDPNHHAAHQSVTTTVLTLFAAGLSIVACLLSFSELAQCGPDVGEIISFDYLNGPRYWSLPALQAVIVPNGERNRGAHPGTCSLMPSVMAADGGSFVIEAKDMGQPPSFIVHWSGRHTDLGVRDCGKSADLLLQLVQLRTLANVAGGYGVNHLRRLF